MGKYGGGQNVAAYSEDDRKIKIVGEPEVIESEPSVSKDDNALQLDQDVQPSSQKDTALHNYGKAPLIKDSFADIVRPRPSVNEDAYGGGIRRSRYDQRGCEAIVQVSNAGQGYGASAPPQVSLPVHLPEQTPRVIRAQGPIIQKGDVEFMMRPLRRRDNTDCNYGKSPWISDLFAYDTARPLPPVNGDAYGGGTGASTESDQRGSDPTVESTQQPGASEIGASECDDGDVDPTPQEACAKAPQFGAGEGGELDQYTEYFVNAKQTNNLQSGLNPAEPQTNGDVGPRPAVASPGGQDTPSSLAQGLAHPEANLQARTSACRGNQAMENDAADIVKKSIRKKQALVDELRVAEFEHISRMKSVMEHRNRWHERGVKDFDKSLEDLIQSFLKDYQRTYDFRKDLEREIGALDAILPRLGP